MNRVDFHFSIFEVKLQSIKKFLRIDILHKRLFQQNSVFNLN